MAQKENFKDLFDIEQQRYLRAFNRRDYGTPDAGYYLFLRINTALLTV